MPEPLPRGSLRAGTEALRAYGDRGGTDEHAARLVLEAAMPIIVRDTRRQVARQILLLDEMDRQKAANKPPWTDMRTCLRKLSRGESLPELRKDAPDATVPEPAPASLAAEITADQAGAGGSMNPTPDCGGERKPPGATEVWWCDAHREFHGTPPAEEDGNG